MEKLKIQEIISFTKGIKIQETKSQDITKISIDSREVNQDTLFIPIIGEKFDGHTFMESAYNLGCRNFLCDENHEFNKENINLIKVKDTKIALGHIAKGYKEKFNLTTIGITGSVGKTSTKDIISSVLNQKYNTLKTQGNQNNEIGLPKTLLNINKKTQIAVIEMAMDKKGDLNYLTNIVHPNIAIITNIGMSHIMNFKNQEGIFYSKMEIANSLTSKDTLIVNGDDKYLKTLKNKQHDYKLLTYGFEENNDIYCKDYKIEETSSFTCVYKDKEYKFKIASPAKHNIGNALIAIILGIDLGLTKEQIEEGLLNIEMTKNRLELVKTDKYTIINDTYNANYDSVMSAISVLNNYKTRKVAILGDILELGGYSEEIHRKLGKDITCDLLISIGKESKYTYEEAVKKGIKAYYFLTKEEFYDKIKQILKPEDTILVKASRGMELDKLVEKLK